MIDKNCGGDKLAATVFFAEFSGFIDKVNEYILYIN